MMPSIANPAEKLQYRKRLIVGCDGSWQASDRATGNVASNITNICRAVAPEASLTNGEAVQQIVYYQPGIGTHYMMAGPAQLGNVAANELAGNVVEAYNFICSNYEQGDQIYLFGFSRGAFTARALAGMICSVGIIKKYYMARFSEIYAKYRNNESVEDCIQTIDDEAQQSYKDIYGTMDGYDGIHEAYGNETPRLMKKYGGADPFMVEIEIVGVWDTVGALGWPETWLDTVVGTSVRKWFDSGYRYLNVALSDRIKHAYHALALDEHRRPFSPTLWHKPKGNVNTELIQCWFAGIHINIGGGTTSTSGDRGQISDLTFAWMVDLCRPYLAFDQGFLDRFAATHHITAKALRTRAQAQNPPIKIDARLPPWADPNVGLIRDAFNSVPFYGSRTRSPGEYNLENALAEVGSQEWTEKWENFVTNEYIHPSVRIRLAATAQKLWRPDGKGVPWSNPVEQRALRHFTFTNSVAGGSADPGKEERNLTRPGSGYVWTKSSTVNDARLVISEWAVGSAKFKELNLKADSFEQQLLMEVEHETCTAETSVYEGVWADMKKPLQPLDLPPAAHDKPVYDRLSAGGVIIWKTSTLIVHDMFGLLAAGPKVIINAVSGKRNAARC